MSFHQTMAPEQHWFSAGSYRFSVECTSQPVEELIEYTLRDLRAVPADGFVPVDRFRIDEEGSATVVTRNGAGPARRFSTWSGAVGYIVGMVNRRSLDCADDTLNVHAAAASIEEGTAILLAPSGGGKTTAVAGLVADGWRYLTDEMVSLSTHPLNMTAIPKPLTVKKSGFSLFQSLMGRNWVPYFGADAPEWSVPVSDLGGAIGYGGEPTLIVMLDESIGGRPTVESRSATMVALVEQCMDLDRFGPGGYSVLAQLCAQSRCIRIPRTPPEKIGGILRQLINLPVAPADVEHVERPDDWPYRPVVTIRLDDEIFVGTPSSGRVAALSIEAADAWCRLLEGGKAGYRPEPRDVPLVAGLVEAGLLVEKA